MAVPIPPRCRTYIAVCRRRRADCEWKWKKWRGGQKQLGVNITGSAIKRPYFFPFGYRQMSPHLHQGVLTQRETLCLPAPHLNASQHIGRLPSHSNNHRGRRKRCKNKSPQLCAGRSISRPHAWLGRNEQIIATAFHSWQVSSRAVYSFLTKETDRKS